MISGSARFLRWLVTGFALVAVAACGSIDDEPQVHADPAAAKIVPVDAADARERINEVRRRHGAPPLTAMPVLQDVANAYSLTMARKGKMAHSFGPGTHLRDRLKGVVAFSLAAENLGAGQDSVDRLVRLWLESPGHRRNLLDTELTHFGLGRAINPTARYKAFWTLILIRPPSTPPGGGATPMHGLRPTG